MYTKKLDARTSETIVRKYVSDAIPTESRLK
jgi:hypothetical protein